MRSKLFVPASRPELFSKAMLSAADALSFDLEDAVAIESKGMARAALESFLRGNSNNPASARASQTQQTLIVRVNAVGTAYFEADLNATIWPTLNIINLPMVESPQTVCLAAEKIAKLVEARDIQRPVGILANIESPRGLRMAAEIASSHPSVVGLQIGYGDLFAPLGILSGEPSATQFVRTAVRMAAGEAGIPAYDGAFVNFQDREGFRLDSIAAKQLGFAGRSCIHPSQIEVMNEVFMPSKAELAYAMKVVRAAEINLDAGVGAFTVDGRLVDGPFITESKNLLALATRLGITP
jgi:citrate lyase subunit beta/citryl-CoA lyase